MVTFLAIYLSLSSLTSCLHISPWLSIHVPLRLSLSLSLSPDCLFMRFYGAALARASPTVRERVRLALLHRLRPTLHHGLHVLLVPQQPLPVAGHHLLHASPHLQHVRGVPTEVLHALENEEGEDKRNGGGVGRGKSSRKASTTGHRSVCHV